MKEACTWLSSNCQPKDILMKWSPLSLAIGCVLSSCTLTGVLHVVTAPLSFSRLLKTASEFPSESGGQESKHHVSVLSDIK